MEETHDAWHKVRRMVAAGRELPNAQRLSLLRLHALFWSRALVGVLGG